MLSRERVRVLLVAGAPTWEYRLVQKLLARDKTIIVSCWLQTLDEERAQEGTRPITRLPVTKDELFYYDVVLLFDPNPQEFDQAWIELLKQFVGEHSGGLLLHGRAQALRPAADQRPHGRVRQAAAGQLRRRRGAGGGRAPLDEPAGLAAEGRARQRRPSGDAVLSRAARKRSAAGKRCPAFSGASPRRTPSRRRRCWSSTATRRSAASKARGR